jgi:hypothetical protein
MRQILVDYARARKAARRDGGIRLTLDDALAFKTRSLDMVALDDALNQLARLNSQQSRIVELRFFGGLSIEETSRANVDTEKSELWSPTALPMCKSQYDAQTYTNDGSKLPTGSVAKVHSVRQQRWKNSRLHLKTEPVSMRGVRPKRSKAIVLE